MAAPFCQCLAMQNIFRALACSFLAGWLAPPVHSEETLLTKQQIVQANDLMWAANGLKLPEVDPETPIIGAQNRQDGVRLLRVLMGKDGINGFNNVIYDNRDRGHSLLDPDLYPALTHLKYGPQLKSAALDAGLGGRILFPAVVFGNSSTAVANGPAPRSLPRLAMTHPAWRQITPFLYANNHIYVYPEHLDHDDIDLFPVNWPYMIISQGSSKSDKPFLNAIALSLAAMPADTFAFLRDNGLIAPTLQMLLRRNMHLVETREDYLSGVAHPPVFEGRWIKTGQMVGEASKLRPEDVPPLIQLQVVEEDFETMAGLARLSEQFLNTPAAIGRIWRSFAWEREMVISAEQTKGPMDQPLTFEWRLLRGDEERVTIEPMGPDGRRAKIRIAWHDPWLQPTVPGKPSKMRRASRVDIGVFASFGGYDSAPAIISIDFPRHQVRQYADHADGKKRISSIDYDAVGRKVYFDPQLYWSAEWVDQARYDESGNRLIGWDRATAEGVSLGFAAENSGNEALGYALDFGNQRTPILRPIGEVEQPKSE